MSTKYAVFFLLLATVNLTGCLDSSSESGSTPAQSTDEPEETPNFTEEDVIEKAKEVTVNNFYDPDSAIFRDLTVVSRHSQDDGTEYFRQGFNSDSNYFYVCGEVNGKNRFGAYVGYEKFNASIDYTSSNDILDGFGIVNPGFSGIFYDWYKEVDDACNNAI